MSNRLRDEAKRASIHQATSNPKRQHDTSGNKKGTQNNWRLWLLIATLLFGSYVYLGPVVLKEEYQWRVLQSIASGKGEAAGLRQTIPAEAEKAAAITDAQKKIEVPAAIRIAEGAERAKVAPAVETAASTARIAVQQKTEEAKIAVWTATEQAKIEVAKTTLTDMARAYQSCIDRAQQAAESAGQSAAQSRYGTLAEQEVARTRAYDLAVGSCDQYKPANEKALSRAEKTANQAAKQIQTFPK